jgi:hypothetical protein
MAPNSVRIFCSKESYPSREEARQAGNHYLNALEPMYQAGRSFKTVKSILKPGEFEYEVYLGDKLREFYR